METVWLLIRSQMITRHTEKSNRHIQAGVIRILTGTATWSMEPASEASCGHRRVWFPTAGPRVSPWGSERVWWSWAAHKEHTLPASCCTQSCQQERSGRFGYSLSWLNWYQTNLFSLDANPSEWEEGTRWSCTMQISWVTGWYLPEAVQLGVQVGKAACMNGQGWGTQTDKNISEAENKSEYIGIYKHWFPTPQQL